MYSWQDNGKSTEYGTKIDSILHYSFALLHIEEVTLISKW